MSVGRPSASAAALATLAGYALAARPWHLAWGAEPGEASGPLAGDAILPAPSHVSTRAVTIDAEPAAVWPWLVQLGQGRGGLYSHDWLENLVGLDIHSAERVVPDLQRLAVGDRVRLSPDRYALVVREVEPERALVLEYEDGGWTWAFALRALADGRTRLVVRNRWATGWRGTGWRLAFWAMEPAAFVMERRMLRGIRERAERAAR